MLFKVNAAQNAWEAQASLLCLCSGAIASLTYYYMVDFSDVPHLEILQAFCLGQLLIQLPLLLCREPGSRPVLILAFLGGIVGISYLPKQFIFAPAVTAAGAIVVVLAIRRYGRQALRFCPWALPIFILLGAVGMRWVYGYGLLSPLFLKRILFDLQHSDSMMHMALTSMLKTFGVPSTGLDGIAYTPGHFGSHYLLARISILFNTSTPDIYIIYYPAVFFPFFWGALTLCAQAAQPIFTPLRQPSLSGWIFLLFFFALLPTELDHTAKHYIVNLFGTESHLIAIAFSLLFCALFSCLFVPQAAKYSFTKLCGILFYLLLCGFMTTFCKIPVGFCLCCLVGVVFLYFLPRVRLLHVAAVILFAAGNLWLAKVLTPSYLLTPWGWFDFVKRFNTVTFLLHLVLHHAPFWVLFWLLGLRNHTWNPLRFPRAERALLAIAALSTIGGLSPTMVVPMPANGADYFSMTRWWLLPVCLVYFADVGLPLPTWSEWRQKTVFYRKGALVFSLLLAVCLAFSVENATRGTVKALRREMRIVRRAEAAHTATPEKLAQLEERRRNISALTKLQKTPLSEKRDALVYIPRTEISFWAGRWQNDFLIPALSEYAALESVSEPSGYPNYGYINYPTYAELAQAEHTREYLRNRARRLGFSEVIVGGGCAPVLLNSRNATR